MRYLLIGIACICLSACSSTPEGLIGEWEGTTQRVNSNGKLIEATLKCTIRSNSNAKRNVELTVAGAVYEYEALEASHILSYKDQPILNDTMGITYITGTAELQNDTLLHFDHSVYAMRDGALLYSNKETFEMVRK